MGLLINGVGSGYRGSPAFPGLHQDLFGLGIQDAAVTAAFAKTNLKRRSLAVSITGPSVRTYLRILRTIQLDNSKCLPYVGPMHILAEEVFRLKELVEGANRAINEPSPDLGGATELLAQASNFLTEIVEEQPRPARAAETS